MNEKEYVIVKDSSGHWFVVAVADLDAFHVELDKLENGDDGSLDGLDVTMINGPQTKVCFTGWRIA